MLQSCGSFLGTRAQSVLHTGKTYLSTPWINQRNASKAVRKQAVANQSLVLSTIWYPDDVRCCQNSEATIFSWKDFLPHFPEYRIGY